MLDVDITMPIDSPFVLLKKITRKIAMILRPGDSQFINRTLLQMIPFYIGLHHTNWDRCFNTLLMLFVWL